MEENGVLEELGRRLDADWPAIRSAREETQRRRAELNAAVSGFTSADASFVVFGSLARGEVTAGSDLDWTLLVDGQIYPEIDDTVADIREAVEALSKRPGQEGTFGGLASGYNLVHQIGGSEDTNRNLTQRILLLLESVAIGRADAHTRVTRALLDRYIAEDWGWSYSLNPFNVPRFLQNDIARYWRTVAVDFAYKRKDRGGRGAALRTVKLRMSRKLTYAAGLVACFRCSLLPAQHPGYEELDLAERVGITTDALERFLVLTPMEMLAWAYLHFQLDEAAKKLFESYDGFLGILNSDERKELDGLSLDAAKDNPVFKQARELGHDFQAALNDLFLPADGKSAFYGLTRTFGVF